MPIHPATPTDLLAELDRVSPERADELLGAIVEARNSCDAATMARLQRHFDAERAVMFGQAAFELRAARSAEDPEARVFAILAREHRQAAEAAALIASAMPERPTPDPSRMWAIDDE